ncbi:hypothetical protein ACWEV4_24745 [Streptomyces sp. NPDC003860]
MQAGTVYEDAFPMDDGKLPIVVTSMKKLRDRTSDVRWSGR